MSKNGSKALRNMLPNSRMDRQNRPKQFFRQKDRVETAAFFKTPANQIDYFSEEQEKRDAEEALRMLEKMLEASEKQTEEEQEIQLAAQKLGCTPDHVRYLISIFEKGAK